MTIDQTTHLPEFDALDDPENDPGIEYANGQFTDKRVGVKPSAIATTSLPRQLCDAQSEAGVEFADGQITEKPASIESNEIAATITALLKFECRKTRSAKVYASGQGYQCYPDDPKKFRKPDVSLMLASRVAGMDPQTGLFPFTADLVVEVISPTDEAYHVDIKVEEYLSAGFPLLWFVHPATRTVAIYRADGTTARLRANDDIAGESALPTFRCKVAEFFE